MKERCRNWKELRDYFVVSLCCVIPSVLATLLFCTCLIGIKKSTSVSEREVKVEQAESNDEVITVLPTPKVMITIDGTHVLVIGYPNVVITP